MSSSSNDNNSRYSLSRLLNPDSHSPDDTTPRFSLRSSGANAEDARSNSKVVNCPGGNIALGQRSIDVTSNLATSALAQPSLSTPASLLATNGSISNLVGKGPSQNERIDILANNSVSATVSNASSTYAKRSLESSASTRQFGRILDRFDFANSLSSLMSNNVQTQPIPTSRTQARLLPSVPIHHSNQSLAHNDTSHVSPSLVPNRSTVVHNVETAFPVSLISSLSIRPSSPEEHPPNPIVIDRTEARTKPAMQNLHDPIHHSNTTTSTAAVDVIPQTPNHPVFPPRSAKSTEHKMAPNEIPGLYKLIIGEKPRKKQWKCTYILPPGKPKRMCGHITYQPRDRTRHINTHARQEMHLVQAGKLHMKETVAYPHRQKAVFECKVPDCEYYEETGEQFRVVGYRVDTTKSKHNRLYHPETGRKRGC